MKLSIMLLATCLVVVATPLATADETDPDCEDNQPWIGYSRTDPVRNVYQAQGSPLGLALCEGEHWDGQDTVQSDQPANCNAPVNPDPNDLFVGYCLGPDPNSMEGGNPLNPLGLRVGAKDGAVYASANIGLVGRAAVYTDDSTTAIYLRDNTPGNVLATVVSTARITTGYVDENDCPQSVYQAGAYAPPSSCGRDNTAITLEHGLLA